MKPRHSPSWLAGLGALAHSIRFKLVMWFTAILAVILCIFSFFLYYTQSRNLQADALRQLERRVTGLTENVSTSLHAGNIHILVPTGLLQDEDVFILLSPDGQILASQGPISPIQVLRIFSSGLQAAHGSAEIPIIRWTSPASQNYAFFIRPLEGQYGINWFMVFGGVVDPNALGRRFLLTLVVGSLLTLLIAMAGGLWLADRAMRPVKTITQAARSMSESDLSKRLNMHTRDELGELANTFDGMLARLQAAFERQRQFVADASHELRTPLTIVNLETSRMLASAHPVEDYRHALSIVRTENNFMTRLVNDLLTLARMDAGQTTLNRIPLDLSDVVVETLERLTPLANRNRVTLEAGPLPETIISGDRQHLMQMLSNLVENAIKYSRGELRQVHVETGTTDGQPWVRVSDTGEGIAAEHLPHLFDRFFRVDRSRTRSDPSDFDPDAPAGSGLGLSIVQWIARQHQAEVLVESTPGKGSCFKVKFMKKEE